MVSNGGSIIKILVKFHVLESRGSDGVDSDVLAVSAHECEDLCCVCITGRRQTGCYFRELGRQTDRQTDRQTKGV